MSLLRICSSGDNPCKSGAVPFNAWFTERTPLAEVTRSRPLLPLYFPLIAELPYVHSDWTDSIYRNCCLALLTTFFYKGTYLHLSFQGRKSDSSKEVCNASTVCSLSNVTWMLYIVAGIRHKCCDSRCLPLLLLNCIGAIV